MEHKYIDADALMEKLDDLHPCNLNTLHAVIGIVCDMPAADVESVRKWIPCSERLPEEYGEYLVAWIPKNGSVADGNPHYYEGVEYDPDEGWIGEITQAQPFGYEIIAWMELPGYYKMNGGSE